MPVRGGLCVSNVATISLVHICLVLFQVHGSYFTVTNFFNKSQKIKGTISTDDELLKGVFFAH